MRKVKFLSICVIILSVIALGAAGGKYFFNFLENKVLSSSSNIDRTSNSPTVSSNNLEKSIKQSEILYSSENISSGSVPSTQILRTVGGSKPTLESGTKVATNQNQNLVNASYTISQVASSSQTNETIDYEKVKWFAFAIGDGINVRAAPSTDKSSKIIMKVGKGTRGRVLERKDGWTRVKWDFNKKIGWTRDDLLICGPESVFANLGKIENIASLSAETVQKINKKAIESVKTMSVAIAKPAPPSETVKGFFGGKPPENAVVIASPFARVRSQPDRRSAELGRIPKGISVKITNYKKVGKYNWFEISYHNGKKHGWTREDNLSLIFDQKSQKQ